MFGKIKFGETPMSLKKLRADSGIEDGDSSGWSSQVSVRASRKTLNVVPATVQEHSAETVPQTALSLVPDEEQDEVFISETECAPTVRPTLASEDVAVTGPKNALGAAQKTAFSFESDREQDKVLIRESDIVHNERPTIASEDVAVNVHSNALGAAPAEEDNDQKLDEVPSNVTSGESSGFQGVFKLLDPNGDGFITLDKLRRASEQLGLSFTEEEMNDMIQEADPSGKGHVNYKEVDTLFVETKVAMDAEQKLMADIEEAFDLFDTGQDGMLRTTKLAKALRIANMYPTEKDVRLILRNLGYPIKITFRQFRKIAVEVSRTDNERLVAAFQCFDKDNTGYLSEEKLRQILRPAICKDFKKKDLEQIISDFSADGKIDLEVFVAYMTGQEQYLSTAKRPNIRNTALKLPAISEESSQASGRSKNKLKV